MDGLCDAAKLEVQPFLAGISGVATGLDASARRREPCNGGDGRHAPMKLVRVSLSNGANKVDL